VFNVVSREWFSIVHGAAWTNNTSGKGHIRSTVVGRRGGGFPEKKSPGREMNGKCADSVRHIVPRKNCIAWDAMRRGRGGNTSMHEQSGTPNHDPRGRATGQYKRSQPTNNTPRISPVTRVLMKIPLGGRIIIGKQEIAQTQEEAAYNNAKD
jgi:hypothetical protein